MSSQNDQDQTLLLSPYTCDSPMTVHDLEETKDDKGDEPKPILKRTPTKRPRDSVIDGWNERKGKHLSFTSFNSPIARVQPSEKDDNLFDFLVQKTLPIPTPFSPSIKVSQLESLKSNMAFLMRKMKHILETESYQREFTELTLKAFFKFPTDRTIFSEEAWEGMQEAGDKLIGVEFERMAKAYLKSHQHLTSLSFILEARVEELDTLLKVE